MIGDIAQEDAVFWTKSDLSGPTKLQRERLQGLKLYEVSSHEPQKARRVFETYLSGVMATEASPVSPLIGSSRRVNLLKRCDERLETASQKLAEGSFELGIEEIRAAARAVTELTGEIDQEDVLDALFSKFCIGK